MPRSSPVPARGDIAPAGEALSAGPLGRGVEPFISFLHIDLQHHFLAVNFLSTTCNHGRIIDIKVRGLHFDKTSLRSVCLLCIILLIRIRLHARLWGCGVKLEDDCGSSRAAICFTMCASSAWSSSLPRRPSLRGICHPRLSLRQCLSSMCQSARSWLL